MYTCVPDASESQQRGQILWNLLWIAVSYHVDVWNQTRVLYEK